MSSTFKFILLIILLAAGYGVRNATDRREKAQKFANDVRDIAREGAETVRQEFEKDGAISPETSSKLMSKLQGQFNAATNLGGDEGKAMQIMSTFVGDMKKHLDSYDHVVKRIAIEEPWDFSRVKEKSDLERHRDIARQLLKVNQEMRTFLDSAESSFRAKFQAAGLTGPKPQQMLAGFSGSFGKNLPIQRRIRDADETMSKCLLEICDLLEANWAKWRIKNGDLTFDSDALLAKHNAIVERVQKAEADQTAAQRELLSRQRR
jgi:hypothetical protein